MKKFLFVTVPIGTTYFPELAIPTFVSQLRNKGFHVSVKDYNIEFLREIYTASYLNNSILKAKEQYNELKNDEKICGYDTDDNYQRKIQTLKYEMLDEFFRNHSELAEKIPLSIEKTLKILKSEELFYNPKLLHFAHKMLHYANKVACLPYAPFDYYNLEGVYYEDICKIIFDKSQNIYMDYFENKIQEIKDINSDFIGISISYGQQLVAGLTLAYLLKKNTNAHICIGGNYFSRLTDYIPNYKEFFNQFVDSVSYGEGENSVLELAKYIEGSLQISEVSQLIYLDKTSGKVQKNKMGEPVVLSRINAPDYSDFDLDNYLLPEKLLPLQVQRGCYWNKCAFCSMAYEKTLGTKKIEDVIKELKYNKEKYDVKSYFIVDESITLRYLEDLADAIVENDLGCKFMISLRLEGNITNKLMKKLYKAGFRSIWWGIESANKRLLKKMNKGININKVPSFLKAADMAGIANFCFFINGFPSSTYEEEIDSLEFLKRNVDIIHNFKTSKYVLVKNSKVYDNPENYGVEIYNDEKPSRISVFYDYKQAQGMNEYERQSVEQEITVYYDQKVKYIFAPLYHFLYCNKYGLKYIKENIINMPPRTKIISKLFSKLFDK